MRGQKGDYQVSKNANRRVQHLSNDKPYKNTIKISNHRKCRIS